MPSMRLYGRSWHLASDALALLGLALLLVNTAWLAAYATLLTPHLHPPDCPSGGVHAGVVAGLLAFEALNVVTSALLLGLATRGTPLETSKRRPVELLMYVQTWKWAAGLGLIIFCFWAVYSTDPQCWRPHGRRDLKILLWLSCAVYLVIALTMLLGYNFMSTYGPQRRWRARLRLLAWVMGCSNTLTAAAPQLGDESQGQPPLEELAASFAQFFGRVDLEKSDVLAGLVLAQIMQAHQRRGVVARALVAAGVQLDAGWLRRLGSDADPALASGGGDGVAEAEERLQRRCKSQGGESEQQQVEEAQQPPVGKGNEGGQPQHQQQQHQPPGTDADPELGADAAAAAADADFWVWLRDISEGRNWSLTPSKWAARLAPDLPLERAADLYTGVSDRAPRGVLDEALLWSRFAIAAYGGSGYVWRAAKFFYQTRLSTWAARAELWRATHPRARVVDEALPPVRQRLQESRAYVRHYEGARRIAQLPHEDFVYTSFTNTVLGATPYIICLHRETRTVVLAIRGSNSMDDLVTDLMDRPIDITTWLPDSLRQEHPRMGTVTAHMGMFAAAKAALEDLCSHQLLRTLLTGTPLSEEERRGEEAGLRACADERMQQWRAQHAQRGQPARQFASGSILGRWDEAWQGNGSGAPPHDQGHDGSASTSTDDQELAGLSSRLRRAWGWLAARWPGRRRRQRGKDTLEHRLSPAEYEALLQERGLDCRGWRLVVTGHSLGGAAAALVGAHCRSWHPDTEVWAFNPPGGMTTPNCSHAMESFVTSVVINKDIISRTSNVTFERLMDQVVVALARCRVSKLHVLLRARSRALRRAPQATLFRPVDDIPPEALAVARSYFNSKCRFVEMLVPMCPPGRVLHLRRLKGADPAGRSERWEALWVPAERVVEEGILLSSRQAKDHYTATLSDVLARAAASGEP